MDFRDSYLDAFIDSLLQSPEGKEAQKKSENLVFRIEIEKEIEKEFALSELLEIAIADTEIGFERSPFHKQLERTREIGERLNALGGYKLMLWAHQHFSRTDGNSLERVWHGIGKWKS